MDNKAFGVKILHIITTLELGGAQKIALSMFETLSPEDYEKHFISSPGGLLCAQAAEIPRARICFWSCLQRPIRPFADMLCLLRLSWYMRKQGIDIVHTHSSKAGIIGRWAAKLAGAKIIVHSIHGWSFNDYIPAWSKVFYVWLERLTARATTCFIAVCRADVDKGLKNGIGKKEQYVLIRYGIDERQGGYFSPESDLRQELGLGQEAPLIAMIACLKPQKNPQDFIRAAAMVCQQNPLARFVCVGEGELRSRLEAEIKQQGLEGKVFLLGWRRDVARIIAACEVICLSSLWEGQPLALLEAMAAAKPVVAYAVDGVPEIIMNGRNGFLVRPRDIAGLAEKLNYCLVEKENAREMGQRGREMFKAMDFSASTMCTALDQLYRRLARENRVKARK